MYCLDTNILVDIIRGDNVLGDKIDDLMDKGVVFYITPITLCELYRGAYSHAQKEDKLLKINSYVSNFELLEFDSISCDCFGKTYSFLKKSGKMTGEFDLIIASIVMANDLVLITRNEKDFEYIDVKLEVW